MSQPNPNVDDIPLQPEYVTVSGRTSWNPGKLRQWHEMLMDFMLLNPRATQIEIAEHFDCHPQTISNVVNSDLFKMKFDQRKQSFQARVDGTAIERLQGKLAGVAERALDVLDEKIQAERLSLGIDAVKESAEMVLKSLGYGLQKPAAHATNVQVNLTVSKADLTEARDRALAQGVERLIAPGSGE